MKQLFEKSKAYVWEQFKEKLVFPYHERDKEFSGSLQEVVNYHGFTPMAYLEFKLRLTGIFFPLMLYVLTDNRIVYAHR